MDRYVAESHSAHESRQPFWRFLLPGLLGQTLNERLVEPE